MAQSAAGAGDLLGAALRAAGLPRPAAAFRAKPDTSCETISNVCVTDRAIEETILLSFEVRGAGIRELSFLLPWWMADSRISVPLLQRKSVRPVDKSPDSPVRVRIELQDEVMGQLRVLVENDRLPTPKAHAAPIPVVETGRTNRQCVALKSAGRDELSVQSALGLEPLNRNQGQWRELTAALGSDVTLAYMVAAGGQRPRLEFKTVEMRGRRSGRGEHRPGGDEACARRRRGLSRRGDLPREQRHRAVLGRRASPAPSFGPSSWPASRSSRSRRPTGEQMTPCGKGTGRRAPGFSSPW